MIILIYCERLRACEFTLHIKNQQHHQTIHNKQKNKHQLKIAFTFTKTTWNKRQVSTEYGTKQDNNETKPTKNIKKKKKSANAFWEPI